VTRRAALGAVLLVLVAGCLSGPQSLFEDDREDQREDVRYWPAGRALFMRDPNWHGGDGAQTVELSDGRILWLFGDSRVEPRGDRGDQQMALVHNSVAIQNGSNPAEASFRAYWGTVENTTGPGSELPVDVAQESRRRPTAFFPNESEEIWYWPAGPVLLEDSLLVFANRVQSKGEGAFGFESAGWRVFVVDQPDRTPSRWQPQRVDPQVRDYGYTVGISAVKDGGSVYAYAQKSVGEGQNTTHAFALARWNASDLQRGSFDQMQWWAGEANGWQAAPSEGPSVLFEVNAASLTVHRTSDGDYQVTAVESFPRGNITVREAPNPEGPFSEPRVLFTPPGVADDEARLYAARAHPHLDGGDPVLTWHNSGAPRPQMARG